MLRFLRWSDVDPTTHTFDAARTRAIVERVVASAHDGDRVQLAESIDRSLLAEHGVWAVGWSWSVTEGGPVRAWCSAAHSLLRRSEPAAASVERVVAAATEWHEWLVTLASLFSQLHAETADLSIEEGVERAAARLLPPILERTGYEDAWYATFERAVSWYLDASGHDPSARLVRDVVSGHFASWAMPSTEESARVCTELGLSVAIAATGSSSPPDALAAWRDRARQGLRARARVPRPRASPSRWTRALHRRGRPRARSRARPTDERGARFVSGLGAPRRAARSRAHARMADRDPR